MNKNLAVRLASAFTFSLVFAFIVSLNVIAGSKTETATLSGGCFWSMEALFQRVKGVVAVTPGYAGGFAKNPSYEQVCTGKTGHAESIQITYDPQVISYPKLLEVFWKVHNPTTLNRQGADEGTQYRSVIFYRNKAQKAAAEKTKSEIAKSGFWGKAPVVTEITPFTNFYDAEDYHKNYYNTHSNEGYCVAVIDPKIGKLKENFRNLLK